MNRKILLISVIILVFACVLVGCDQQDLVAGQPGKDGRTEKTVSTAKTEKTAATENPHMSWLWTKAILERRKNG